MMLLLLPILLIVCYFGPQMNITGKLKQKLYMIILYLGDPL